MDRERDCRGSQVVKSAAKKSPQQRNSSQIMKIREQFEVGESWHTKNDQSSRFRHAPNFAQRLPEALIMFQRGVAKNCVKGAVGETIHCIGVPSQNLESTINVRTVEIESDPLFGRAKTRKAKQGVRGGDRSNFEDTAAGTSCGANLVESLKNISVHKTSQNTGQSGASIGFVSCFLPSKYAEVRVLTRMSKWDNPCSRTISSTKCKELMDLKTQSLATLIAIPIAVRIELWQ